MNTVPVKAYNGLSVQDLRKQLLEETDAANIRSIVNQLNSHLQKKDILRKTEMSELQDTILAQIEHRVQEKGDCFSNKDLLEYFKAMEDSVKGIDSSAELAAGPQIKINQPITINMDKPALSREEKMQVLNAVKSIINKVQDEQLQKSGVVEGEYKELNDNN